MDRLLASEPASFNYWLEQVTSTWHWEWAHLAYIRESLQRVTDGDINKLMLFLPPRHGKSEMVTIRYPVWRLERDLDMRVVVGAYNQALANKFSRKARRIAKGRFALSEERTAVEDWETTKGGGMRAVGMGSGITGQGGDLIVIDDPVKSREEAESPAYREHVYDWYTDDIYTRLEPGGSIILIMTRWHEDDLAGRILASDDGPNWTVISLPALADEDDALGREQNTALCPERFDEESLAGIKTVLGSRSFSALYQQRPQPAEGGMFKRSWFPIADPPTQFERFIRYWDKAATAGGGDYTAGVLLGREGSLFWVLDVVRGQWSTHEREQVQLETARSDAAAYGHLVTWIEQEPGSSGVDSAKATISNMAGFTVRAERSTGSKQVRAEPFAAQAEAGNVRLARSEWNHAYLDEICSFPYGAHDDQIDGSSGAFNKIAETSELDTAPSPYASLAAKEPPTRREVVASTHANNPAHHKWAQKHYCQLCYDEHNAGAEG